MTDHLRLAGRPHNEQALALEGFIRESDVLMRVLEGLSEMDLPDHQMVAGAIYNLAWNRLTSRPALNGINDIDIFYFDVDDLSWEAEDRVIRRLERRFADLPLPVQVRNQARVHLWFPEKFGVTEFAPLTSSSDMLDRYAARAHAVAARLTQDGRMEIIAPFGLDDLFSFRVVPNPVLPNQPAYEAKAQRALELWPELTVLPWPGVAD
ncbi:nucleotidyltransferase family protein [Devosia sp.]|uniref:nucleotidyltransferase family protein n=1 Tax=Devosia sp. TaxID=1871048 RepID=UPI003A918723